VFTEVFLGKNENPWGEKETGGWGKKSSKDTSELFRQFPDFSFLLAGYINPQFPNCFVQRFRGN
jgi:hypothetical protein